MAGLLAICEKTQKTSYRDIWNGKNIFKNLISTGFTVSKRGLRITMAGTTGVAGMTVMFMIAETAGMHDMTGRTALS